MQKVFFSSLLVSYQSLQWASVQSSLEPFPLILDSSPCVELYADIAQFYTGWCRMEGASRICPALTAEALPVAPSHSQGWSVTLAIEGTCVGIVCGSSVPKGLMVPNGHPKTIKLKWLEIVNVPMSQCLWTCVIWRWFFFLSWQCICLIRRC